MQKKINAQLTEDVRVVRSVGREAPLASSLAGGGAAAVAGVVVAQRAALDVIFLETVVVVRVAEVLLRVGDLLDHVLGSHLAAQVHRDLASVRQSLSDQEVNSLRSDEAISVDPLHP